jgi:hypothetical protein
MAPAPAVSSRRGQPSRTPGRRRGYTSGISTARTRRSGGRFVLVGLRLARRGEERWRTGGPGDRQAVGRPRCRSIRPMTAASSMSAIRRRRPPQRGHASTSKSKARAAIAANCDLAVTIVAPDTYELAPGSVRRREAWHQDPVVAAIAVLCRSAREHRLLVWSAACRWNGLQEIL